MVQRMERFVGEEEEEEEDEKAAEDQ